MNIPVSRTLLQKQALYFAQQLGPENFEASNGFLASAKFVNALATKLGDYLNIEEQLIAFLLSMDSILPAFAAFFQHFVHLR